MELSSKKSLVAATLKGYINSLDGGRGFIQKATFLRSLNDNLVYALKGGPIGIPSYGSVSSISSVTLDVTNYLSHRRNILINSVFKTDEDLRNFCKGILDELFRMIPDKHNVQR